jgi:EAL domain-containing protein (putative c-di-GMP-specific phosphodiesterase class I)
VDAAITRAIIAMAHGLSLKVVAEGVERPEQLEFLKAERCDEVQGYLVSRPVEADGLLQLLRADANPL